MHIPRLSIKNCPDQSGIKVNNHHLPADNIHCDSELNSKIFLGDFNNKLMSFFEWGNSEAVMSEYESQSRNYYM